MVGWVEGRPDVRRLDEQLLAPVFTPSPALRAILVVSGLGTLAFGGLVTYVVLTGVGTWGNDIPVAWAFGILHFVWWIGIGHAGTFISAILLLLEQPWRSSVNRIAETMTLFAVTCAGLYPLLHLGRPWFAYWLFPYPSTMGVWPQFRSALTWDVLAVLTYFTISLLFWYLGLVPDLAAARDRAPTVTAARVYGVLALGWRGSARHWRTWRVAYGLLAGLATPLVLSVHSIIGLDFAIALTPGWHSTFFPPFFVVGAIHSGFALVLLLTLALRGALGMQNVVTVSHLEAMARILLATAWLMGYCYAVELFAAWYGGNPDEIATVVIDRLTGTFAWAWYAMVACNVVVPQVLWWRRARRGTLGLSVASVAVLVGMWLERFDIIVQSLAHGRLPSGWGSYTPTVVDGGLFVGTLCLFTFGFCLVVRYLPIVPVSEVKELAREEAEHGAAS